jgi:hypothetical protein
MPACLPTGIMAKTKLQYKSDSDKKQEAARDGQPLSI